jgi:predicted membrane channel-forming protein YqfA (hemolysin III family)
MTSIFFTGSVIAEYSASLLTSLFDLDLKQTGKLMRKMNYSVILILDSGSLDQSLSQETFEFHI